MVELLLDCGADVSVDNDKGTTPLQSAGLNCYFNAVKQLLRHRAYTSVVDDDEGLLPLMLAAYKGHAAVLKLHLENGADVTFRNLRGLTPLICAADGGRIGAVRLIFDHGAGLQMYDAHRWTPLH